MGSHKEGRMRITIVFFFIILLKGFGQCCKSSPIEEVVDGEDVGIIETLKISQGDGIVAKGPKPSCRGTLEYGNLDDNDKFTEKTHLTKRNGRVVDRPQGMEKFRMVEAVLVLKTVEHAA